MTEFNKPFSFVIDNAKALHTAKFARAGWNGKNMHIGLKLASIGDESALAWYMRAADGSLVIGWLASATDMIADDWGLIE